MSILKDRVALDITRQFRRVRDGKIATGIDKVDLAYIRQYQFNACAVLRLKNRWYVLTDQDSRRVFERLLNNQPLSKLSVAQFCARSYLNRFNRPKVLINTSHSGLEQPQYAVEAKRHFKKIAYFLHDLIPLEFPEYCKQGEFAKHQQRVQTILNSGDLVIANSADTLRKFQPCIDAANLRRKIQCTYALLGVDRLVDSKLSENLSQKVEPYFVILGTIEPRKNHLLLLQVWRCLQNQLKDKCPKLYIVGKRGWDIEQVIDILDRAPFAKQSIVEISNASDQEITQLLKHATALLFPSFVEGFGLPLVQALQLSTPVIASNLAVYKELAGDIPEYIDPVDTIQWLNMVVNYTLYPDDARTKQLKRLAQFNIYSWEQHFDVITPEINSLFVR